MYSESGEIICLANGTEDMSRAFSPGEPSPPPPPYVGVFMDGCIRWVPGPSGTCSFDS